MTKIFKFGGASVKDANSIKNLVRVLKNQDYTNLVVVISAMGKMTNAFEDLIKTSSETEEKLAFIKAYHTEILNDLFASGEDIYKEIEQVFTSLTTFLNTNTSNDYDYIYDQTVSYGEILSTKIVSAYLKKEALENTWVDAKKVIQTDSTYRSALVDWKKTIQNCKVFTESNSIYITQGFISGNDKNLTTTLGREGSDYSAGILAYCLDAESVTLWKDVDGVLSADPRLVKDAYLLTNISYKEAEEMALNGASIIHPKTLKPLQDKQIELFVRSFIDLENSGTKIG